MKYWKLLVVLLGLWACQKEEAWRENLIGTAPVGIPSQGFASCADASYDPWDTSEYILPYPVGTSYIIGLGPCGGSYHSAGQPDMFAIDFNMPIGSPIHAARGGRVVYVEERGVDGGFPNNLVSVQHTDGTYAHYAHLTQNGAVVRVGQAVAAGALLGYSGNTGLAGYPHLHFVLTAPGSMGYPYTSLPVTFRNTTPNPKSLESGMRYEAFPP
ncbi:M23 family metallopeptidase [Robiginitalea sediminis]|uniref:M23 family metallopeptidase n=1 Tax=Robiginitalea sediminis TaxID=1982593 RepID=UPI000B4AD190|nr:M23 family metallopeptidase [Robiginitalea sediminis]